MSKEQASFNKDEEYIKNAQTVQKIREKEKEMLLKKKKKEVIFPII